MLKRKQDVAAPIGRPKRARQPRKESDYVYESMTPMPVVPIEGEQAAEQHSAIAGPGHSMQVPTLTEDQMDRIAAKVAAQLNRPRTAAANETVTSRSFQDLTGESTISPSSVDTTNNTIFGLRGLPRSASRGGLRTVYTGGAQFQQCINAFCRKTRE